jgi:hypothetical protein
MEREDPVRAVMMPREPRRKASAAMLADAPVDTRSWPKISATAPGPASSSEEPPSSRAAVEGVRMSPEPLSDSERPSVLREPTVRHAASVAVI